MGGYTSKCEKSQNHCTLPHTLTRKRVPKTAPPGSGEGEGVGAHLLAGKVAGGPNSYEWTDTVVL